MADTGDLMQAFWQSLSDLRAGMLGLEHAAMHMQPMTPYADIEKAELWFIASAESDLVAALGHPDTAYLTIQDPDAGLYASASGPIEVSEDRDKLDDIWSPAAAAYFPGGRDDSDVTLLHMPLRQVAVWRSQDGAPNLGRKIARAALGGTDRPDPVFHAVFDVT